MKYTGVKELGLGGKGDTMCASCEFQGSNRIWRGRKQVGIYTANQNMFIIGVLQRAAWVHIGHRKVSLCKTLFTVDKRWVYRGCSQLNTEKQPVVLLSKSWPSG